MLGYFKYCHFLCGRSVDLVVQVLFLCLGTDLQSKSLVVQRYSNGFSNTVRAVLVPIDTKFVIHAQWSLGPMNMHYHPQQDNSACPPSDSSVTKNLGVGFDDTMHSLQQFPPLPIY